MTDRAGITLRRLSFTGQQADPADLKFANALNILYAPPTPASHSH